MTLAESFEARGRDKGFVEGRTEAQYEMVRRLSSKNLDVAFISEVTGLTQLEIKKILQSNCNKKEIYQLHQSDKPQTSTIKR